MVLRTIVALVFGAGLAIGLLMRARTCGSEETGLAERTVKAPGQQNVASEERSDTFVVLQGTDPLPAGVTVYVEKVAVRTRSARLALCSSRKDHAYVYDLGLEQKGRRISRPRSVCNMKNMLVLRPGELVLTPRVSFTQMVYTNAEAYFDAHVDNTEDPQYDRNRPVKCIAQGRVSRG
ncbi:MAG: hypothetical protein JXB62_11735 [Pirellulales bacterium]|nr:hypothetical protein [Pirellulales bacterium]